MIILKQSTAVDIPIGPFVDDSDGKTPETSLTISQSDIRLKKNGGNWAQKNDSNAATHEENGWYEVALNTTDTNTLGLLKIAVHEAGALPAWIDCMVVPANVYDSLVSGSDALQVHANEITNDLITAAAIASGAIDRATFAADTGLQSARSNTAQAGGSTSITLDASASATTDFYKGCDVYLTGGTGVGQFRTITAYNGSTKVATVTPAWATNPDNTSTFAVRPHNAHSVRIAADGLTNITVAQVSQADVTAGIAGSFEKMVRWLFQRFFNEGKLNNNTNQLTVARDDNTVCSTQAISDTGGVQTVGKAS